MTEQSLRSILRDPSYPRHLRIKAFGLLVRQGRIESLFRSVSNINDFREQTGGCFLPELMVA